MRRSDAEPGAARSHVGFTRFAHYKAPHVERRGGAGPFAKGSRVSPDARRGPSIPAKGRCASALGASRKSGLPDLRTHGADLG